MHGVSEQWSSYSNYTFELQGPEKLQVIVLGYSINLCGLLHS